MEYKLRYFGQLQDLTGKAEETINHKFKTIGELREIKELLKQTDFSKSISFEFNK